MSQISAELKSKPTKEFLKYAFSHDEIHEKGLTLARLSSEQIAIDNERKAVASEFKAKMDAKLSEIEVIGNHINNGYEHRYIDCTINYNDPNSGMKSTYRNDTGELVKKESMTAEEMQLQIVFEKNEE